MQITLDVKHNKMNKFKCKWNWVVSKLMFSIKDCPNKLCTCTK